MTIAIRILAGLPALLFIAQGIQWLVDPLAIAQTLGMPLLEGIGASTQIGDLGAIFCLTGAWSAAAQLPGKSHLFYPAAGFLGGAAVFRTLAYLLGHAEFAGGLIAPEIIMATILVVAARHLSAAEDSATAA